MRTLVRVFGWKLYSDHFGLSLLMQKWLLWMGDTVWERYRLFLEKLSLGSSSSCLNRSTRSLSTLDDKVIGTPLEYEG